MFLYPPKKPGNTKSMPAMPGLLPGLNLQLDADHLQLLGTFVMMGLSRRPGFKEEMEQMMAFLTRMQEAAEAISVHMETVQKEFQKVKAKMAERPPRAISQEGRKEGMPPHLNPLLQHLFRLMS
ncbi:hypothetical protein [Desulforamulus ferrireducens]|uniref:Uncharacterized protein n=1 Tax=Desulforamulus ferrireducens TaxID=1833852 RepID=A0A1S6IUC8_9FIRM|nr:hypothetical protein [Desulforamulus ferrireducens]AQS58380.1 hypothetical protein B0537_04300 [Desulforamulus ferrireducens]